MSVAFRLELEKFSRQSFQTLPHSGNVFNLRVIPGVVRLSRADMQGSGWNALLLYTSVL